MPVNETPTSSSFYHILVRVRCAKDDMHCRSQAATNAHGWGTCRHFFISLWGRSIRCNRCNHGGILHPRFNWSKWVESINVTWKYQLLFSMAPFPHCIPFKRQTLAITTPMLFEMLVLWYWRWIGFCFQLMLQTRMVMPTESTQIQKPWLMLHKVRKTTFVTISKFPVSISSTDTWYLRQKGVLLFNNQWPIAVWTAHSSDFYADT